MTNKWNHCLITGAFLLLTSVISGCLASGAVQSSVAAQQVSMSQKAQSLAIQLYKQGVQVIVLGDNIRIILYADRCFEINTPNILESCQPLLNNIVALLNVYGNPETTIAGYTDDLLTAPQAQLITQNQATSIMTYLWVQGIPYENMQAKGYGFADSIASNFTVRGSAFNRRIEIRFRTGN